MTKFWKETRFSPNKPLQVLDKRFIKRPRLLAAIFFLAITFVACERPEESIGIDLQPSDDILGVSGIDTFTVSAISQAEDSVRTDGVLTGLIGAYRDPIFGFTKAEHTSELRLTSSNPIFFRTGSALENLVIDSLVLNLAFEFGQGVPIYGSTGAQYFEVFEVLDSLDLTEEYYSNDVPQLADEDLVLPGHNLIRPNYLDSSVVDGVAFRPSLRIPLKPELGQRILDASEGDGLSATEFLEVIKGLHITVDENAPGVDLSSTGLLSINSFLGVSRMEMYYRDTLFLDDPVEPGPDTLFYDFEIRASTGKYNGFQHDFLNGGDPTLIRQVINGIPGSGDEVIFAQSAGGVKFRVDLPHIRDLRGIEGIALAKAELIIPLNELSGDRYPVPDRLLLFGLDNNGDAFLLDEFLQDPQNFTLIDGAYDFVNQRYRFLITRFLQQVITDDREFTGFEIVVQRASTTGNRVILNGTEHPDDRMRLNILFTNF